MSRPTPYNRNASFTNLQAASPSAPVPGDMLDLELNAVKATLDQVLANLELIQRDDGELANQSVGYDQLSEELSAGIDPWTVWATATAYAVGNTVFHTSAVYRCLVAHTSGTFATDLGAAKWELIIDLSALTIVAASNIANTPSGSIAATTVQAAIDELASEKAATSHTHPASDITDSTAAGRDMLTAANLAAQKALLELGDLAFLDDVPVTTLATTFSLTGVIEPAALASDTNDWAPTGIADASTVRMSASTAVALTGLLASPTDGTIIVLENVGTTSAITLSPSNTASAAANRFLISHPIIVGPNSSIALKYDKDATTPRWRVLDNVARLPRGYIDGLTLSNGSDATNDINIAVGEARGARGILDLALTTAMVKQLDADWTAGTNAGGRYVSSPATPAIANTTYHVHLIGKADGTTDVIFYTGVDPTSVLPTGYIDYHFLGSTLRESDAIVGFVQHQDTFLRKVAIRDLSSGTLDTTERTTTHSVPLGVVVEVIINGYVNSFANNAVAHFYSPLITANPAVTASAGPGSTGGTVNTGSVTSAAIPTQRILTNTSAQTLRKASSTSQCEIWTHGWVHPRGADA